MDALEQMTTYAAALWAAGDPLAEARDTMTALWDLMRDTLDPGAFELVQAYANLDTHYQMAAGELHVSAALAQDARAGLSTMVQEARALLPGDD